MVQGNILILNLYSVIILLILGFHARKNSEKESLRDKLFYLVLCFTVFVLCMDTLSRFDGMVFTFSHTVNAFGNFVVFLLSPVMPCLWLAYVHLQIFQRERETKRFLCLLGLVNLVYEVVFIIFQHFECFYSIDADNIYRRGPYFWIPTILTILLMLWAVGMAVRSREIMEKRDFLSILFFACPPFIGVILQVAFYGTSLILNSVVISLLVVFLNIQTHSLHTDYLTGVSNRKMLDTHLREKINASNEKKLFAAILVDINDFKHINDLHGHNVGDNALENAAKLLRQSLRTGDFIARFGGDEFCIIADISSETDLDIIVRRIYKCLSTFNRESSHAYKLSFSMGYAVYEYGSGMSPEDFLKRLDTLMYEDKCAFKRRSRLK